MSTDFKFFRKKHVKSLIKYMLGVQYARLQ